MPATTPNTAPQATASIAVVPSIDPTVFWHRLIWIVTAVHCLTTAALSLTRLYTNKASLVDLGVFDQAIWTALRYGIPTTTINFPYELHNWLGFHFSPIVLTLVPVYAFAAVPELLILLQSSLIAVTAFPIFWTCHRLSDNPRHAFLWSMLYLFNPFLLNASVWDFHEKSLALPALGFAYYALVAHHRRLFIVATGWLLLCQEHYGVAVFGFGILWAHHHGDRKFGLLVAAAGIATTITLLFVVMPALNPSGTHAMIGGNAELSRYAWLNDPVPQMLAMVRRLMRSWLLYVVLLFFPTGRAALMAPVFLLPGTADFLANLLSSNPMPRAVFAYHSMGLVPILVIAAARAASGGYLPGARALRISCLVTLALGYLLAPAPLPFAHNFWQIESLRFSRDPAIRDIQSLLVPEMTVSAQRNIGSYFSQRRFIYPFPARYETVDAVILHIEYPYADFRHAPFAKPHPEEAMTDMLLAMEHVVEGSDFGLLYWERNWLLAVRGAGDLVSRDAVRRRFKEFTGRYADSR